MSESKFSIADGYVDFVGLFNREDLEQALISYKGTEQYDAVFRYYFGCFNVPDSSRLLEPLGLLKQALGALEGGARRRRAAEAEAPMSPGVAEGPDLADICNRVEDFQARLHNSLEQLKIPATEVPKNLHFVWLGGGVGEVQRDYINIWKQVMVAEGYNLSLWYDSDALLAYETNRIIVEAAKADAMLNGGQTSADANELGDRYEERAIVLKQQMYAHITKAVESGSSADAARIDLLVRAYGQDEARLNALKSSNRLSLLALVEGGLALRDLAVAEAPLHLADIYEREISLRGNFAAASDVVRVEALIAEGGSYADVDNLPPLLEKLGGVDILAFKTDARLGVLQLMLDRNPEWMPGRQALRSRYTNYFEQIPLEHREALERFAESQPELNRVFRPPVERLVQPDGLRAVAEQSSLSNAFLMAHPGSAMLKTVRERFRLNYEIVDATARLADEKNVALTDAEAMIGLAQEAATQVFGALHNLPEEQDLAVSFLVQAAATYYSDGIRPQSEVTIYLTGPAAMRDGMMDYERTHFTSRTAEAWRAEAAIPAIATVNRATEEELDHSWKENESDTGQWLSNEVSRWQAGQFKTRYAGDLAQLLKYRTIDFAEGWPVIEGRHVVSTDLLQHLADELGEPFMRMMNNCHDGAVTFDKAVRLSFDERQSILAQSVSTRPPGLLSDPQTQQLSIDELLSRLAKGTVIANQVSPLQRLLLAALIGAPAVDNQSFDAARPQLESLANSLGKLGTAGRYAMIEHALYQRQAPAFLAGLASPADHPPAHSETALGLKKNALEQPLTLRQWGKHVARIQQVAKLEFRDQVAERVGVVMGGIEAANTKLVPQDLMLQGTGDALGGRCYPLALVMAAALSEGKAAANTLRERFYLGVLEPETSDSAIFLHSLEALRGVQISEVGSALARSDLNQVVDILSTRTITSTLMLNSDNHAMLVAKTIEGEHSTYHFYDPNFGVLEFDQPAAFRRALEQFFLEQKMAGPYAAYGDTAHPTFDLIELDGARVSKVALPGAIRVSQLLQPGTLPGESRRPVRQRLASARGQSLMSNSRLGSCLLELDGHWWGQQIEQVTSRLRQQNQLAPKLVPLFETLEVMPDGAYRMSLINPENPEHLVRITTDDHRLLRIKNYLSERFAALANKPSVPGDPVDPTDVGSVHTLNAGFAIQALMNALRRQEGPDKPLTMAVRLHAYVNYAQLVHGNVADVAGLVGLVRQALAEEKLIARTVAPVVKAAVGPSVGEATGGLLQLANVGFDIYQLATADNDVERAQFGTQLAFDSASLVLSLGAYAAGATVAGAFLGGAAVILGGLAVGLAAVVQGFATIAEEAKQVGLFFDEIEKAHRQGYRFDGALGAWVPHSSLIVQALDLAAGKLLLDSPKLYPLRDHFGVPTFDDDYERAINIRRELNLPSQIKFTPPTGQIIVLPCTPQTCYSYEYKALPFATLRHDPGFDTARRLEKKKADGARLFLFSFYSFPSEYILYRLFPVYTPTVIDVLLDAVERSLVIPVLPPVWHGKVAYRVQGAGKQCALVLNPGVSLTLESPSITTSPWVLEASWANESDVVLGGAAGLQIGTVKVEFKGRGLHEVLIRIANNQLFQLDRGKRQMSLVEQDVPSGMDRQTLQEHLKGLAQEHRLVMPYTPVHHYLIPYEEPSEPRYTTAWYDAKEERLLYIRSKDVLAADEALLGTVAGGYGYFYEPQGFVIWQVDAVTGLLSYRYRILPKDTGATIKSIEADAQGVIHVVQEIAREGQISDVLVYVIHDGQLLLSSVTRDMDPGLESVFSASDTLADWSQVLGSYYVLRPVVDDDDVSNVDWQPAPFVSVCWKFEANARDMAWVRDSDHLIIRPSPRRHRGRGWADSIKNMTDLTLLTPADGSDVFVIYDRLRQQLCRKQRTLVEGKGQWSETWRQPANLQNVEAVQGGYLALTSEGLFFNLSPQGYLTLGGLGESWLKNRMHWWSALEPLARQYAAESFALVGLSNFNDNAKLCAWYVGNRLLLADLGHGKEVRLLSVTPDSEAAWLFDVSSGEVYRQAFIDPQRLEPAFGEGSRLLLADALPAAEREWAPWQFAEVTVEGAGLRGTTLEGVVLKLRYQEPALLTGITHEWVLSQEGRAHDNLKQLVDSQPHEAVLSVEDVGSLIWFVVDTERVIRVAKTALPESFELLGTQRQTNVLLHENKNGLLLTYPGRGHAGPLSYVWRNAEVLVIEGQKQVGDVLPLMPDDVTTLILRMGQGAVSYLLSKAAWLRLESVILDCRHALGNAQTIPGKLIWELDSPEKLLLSIVQEHLVIIDPDSGHSVIFREVYAADVTLRGDALLGFEGHRPYAVSTLVQRLVARRSAHDSATLGELLTVSTAELEGSLVG
ncbi:YopT-type cysteine protease domain-containing protein [Pseudomonas serboccidentalis]|uniref:YopT-type cysteine protease domain-containing protein n=1 Tax=Pseudomonas serboccidentalis TaxID=2964670 RepID=A0ABY7Z6C7_9PSED|nr:TcdA/TcdB pore-forming domain-containing protein [Pseudomonas serboccidentalis]WDR34791.1 YopT-type cysteine protease domain-containing protein [Pseudomonas serboccidentalis]